MPDRVKFNDLIVVLPGIGGSVLRTSAGPLWEPSLGMAGALLRRRGDLLDELAGDRDKLDDEDYEGDVVATGLIETAVVFPGLAKVNQYHPLRRAILNTLDVIPGDPKQDGTPANYFEFAYDWRRDNRISAAHLKQLVDRELPKWKSTLPYGEPKTILVCHSMGGVVAKYYLDALDGWQHCRALITFGTPYRGSVNALDVLVHGFRKFGVELRSLSEVIGSFTSVYQLLPRYPVIWDARGDSPTKGKMLRVAEVDADLGSLSIDRAVAAYEDFHRAMNEDRSSHAGQRLDRLIRMVPVLGYGQRTLQSATLDDNRLTMSYELPQMDRTRGWLSTGDRTVPAASAIPIECSDGGTWAWENGTHATVHATVSVLERLTLLLGTLHCGLSDLQGVEVAQNGSIEPPPAGPILMLEMEDVYTEGEPVTGYCFVSGLPDPGPATVSIIGVTSPAPTVVRHDGEAYRWTAEGLPPGTYEVTVCIAGRSVSDVFEVC